MTHNSDQGASDLKVWAPGHFPFGLQPWHNIFRRVHAAEHGTCRVARGATWPLPSSFRRSGASNEPSPVRIGPAVPALFTKPVPPLTTFTSRSCREQCTFLPLDVSHSAVSRRIKLRLSHMPERETTNSTPPFKDLFWIVSSVRGYSSVVEHSTADREVPGSNPGAPWLTSAFLSLVSPWPISTFLSLVSPFYH